MWLTELDQPGLALETDLWKRSRSSRRSLSRKDLSYDQYERFNNKGNRYKLGWTDRVSGASW